MHKSLCWLRLSLALKSWRVFASKSMTRMKLTELPGETWDKKIKTKITQTSPLMWMPSSLGPLRQPRVKGKPVQVIDSPSTHYDLWYWSFSIIAVLNAHTLNVTVACSKCYLSSSIYHSPCIVFTSFSRHKPIFFNIITTDTYKDGWITIYPPPQQHDHPLNYPYTPLHRQTWLNLSYTVQHHETAALKITQLMLKWTNKCTT